MPEIHIRLDSRTRKLLSQSAREWNCTLQEYVERTLQHAATLGGRPSFLPPVEQAASDARFTFVDLFAGIGGFRLAFERQGGRCVFTSEWDKWCQKTYLENFGDKPHGDIRQVDPKEIPDHDVLVGGFPCQPFSIAGVSKKKSLGREHGFRDEAQGTLFFNVLEILERKRPCAFLLENVKNLRSHDGGRTYEVIRGSLEELGYVVRDQILDARYWVPQHRERIFIVGFDRKVLGRDPAFVFPSPPRRAPKLASILKRAVDPKYTLSDHLWDYLQQYAQKHRAKGNGFGFGLCNGRSVARTLSARYYKDGSEILVEGRNGDNPRRLTPSECARLMGFPAEFVIPVSDTQAYKQFGNAVVVPVAEAVASELVKVLPRRSRKRRRGGRRR